MAEQEHPTKQDIEAGYEIADINVYKILGFVSSVVVFLIVAFILMNSYFISSKEQIYYEQVLQPGSEELRQLREQADEQMNSYAIIDSAENIYQIPIDQAMKSIADEEFQKRVQQSGEQASN